MDTAAIIDFFYPGSDPAKAILLKHSMQVRDKAMELLKHSCRQDLDTGIIIAGAMLHDIGIRQCHAPDIGCHGTLPYIAHGIAGAKMLRSYGQMHALDMEVFARICERHTGSGLSASEIRARALPLPEIDLLPETPEERLVCLADKFFSKGGDFSEKSVSRIRSAALKFGTESLRKLDALLAEFQLN